ncbi:MAG: SIS domain-containing protein, partial [Bacteroidota bacterium]
YRSQARIEINKEIIAQRTPHIREIWSRGDSMLERSLYLIHLTDWVSCYLADRKAIDAVEVNVINHLKGSLAKLGEQ